MDGCKLDDSKSEAIVIGRKCHTSSLGQQVIKLGEANVPCAKQIRNLGATFDQEMSMHAHVSNLCQSTYFHLHKISKLRKYLSKKSTEALVHSVISSRLDQNNSILYGATKDQLNRIQHAQNAAARVISKLSKYDHITPILKD